MTLTVFMAYHALRELHSAFQELCSMQRELHSTCWDLRLARERVLSNFLSVLKVEVV